MAAAERGEQIVSEFVRFCEKNPLFVRSIDNFISKNCSRFEGEAGDETSGTGAGRGA